VQSTFAGGFNTPISMAFDSAGDLFVGSGYGDGNGIITKITPGGTQSLFASGLNFPGGMTFNGAGDLLVTEQDTGTILLYTPGGVESTFATTSYNSLNGLAFNSAGDLFVGASVGSIVEITTGGAQSTFASGLGNPAGLAFQPVPEPSTVALAAIGALAFFARRHRQ
jgi:glucose/arabinose dehydrogenase